MDSGGYFRFSRDRQSVQVRCPSDKVTVQVYAGKAVVQHASYCPFAYFVGDEIHAENFFPHTQRQPI
jgi:hypothetical protein